MLTSVALAQSQDVAWDGPYTVVPPHTSPVPHQHCCELAHAILLAKPGVGRGKVLLIQTTGQRWTWDPAAPNSIGTDALCDFDAPDAQHNLFCAGHSADSAGDVVLHGGTRYHFANATPMWCTPQPKFSYVYDASNLCWSSNHWMLDPNMPPPHQSATDFQNRGYWYPGSMRLPDGRVMSVGGGSSPVTTNQTPNVCGDTGGNYFIDGFQIYDAASASWIGANAANQWWFDGLPGSYALGAATVDFDFNWYPLVSLIPTTSGGPIPGFVFAGMVTDNRGTNEMDLPGYLPRRGPSGLMGLHATWPANGSWGVHLSEVTVPGTSTPRNILYPNGFLWPLHLDNQGLPLGPTRFVMLGGTDNNAYLSDTNVNPAPVHPAGGRPALGTVYSIDQPEAQGAVWSTAALPPLTLPRIYSNAVILPDEQLFVVGGSSYDFLPYRGQTSGWPLWSRERTAEPVFFPEMIDLTNPTAQWVLCSPHTSPRLYHSAALLLPDARVLVCGGYHGVKPDVATLPANWTPENHTWTDFIHSDIEIFSPDYLFAGVRPQVVSVNAGNPIGYGASSTFAVQVARAGSTSPAAEIGSVCLISPGAVTHHYDWDQRFVGLHFAVSTTSPDRFLTVTPPDNAYIAQPGFYMLFVVTDPAVTNGVKIPSVAAFVRLQ